MTCLLAIDLQAGFFDLPRPLFGADALLQAVGSLLDKARSHGSPIVYVCHSGAGPGPLSRGSDGWQFHRAVAPRAGELVVEKRHCDAFQGTGLEAMLKDLGVTRLVVCGLATEGCVDTTIRRAFSLGFTLEIACDGHSTTDSRVLTAVQIITHHNEVFKIFGDVKPASEITFVG